MSDACGLSIIDRQLRALKLLDQFVAGRKALVHGDEVAFGGEDRRRRDSEDAKSSRNLGLSRCVDMNYT